MSNANLVYAGLFSVGAFCALGLQTAPAQANIELLKTDDTTVFVNGRMQAFLNYNNGDGSPQAVVAATPGYVAPAAMPGMADPGITVALNPGSADDTYEERAEGAASTDQGKIEELRIRTGFVGNVLGFGFRHRIDDTNEVLGYTAATTYIDSASRRKYTSVTPDWRESFLKVQGDWGSVVAGRTLVLFNRGATEITYLYGYKYGLGWPGNVGSYGGNGPGAGHVGFGVLGNGFGAGLAYATPDLSGAQLTVGLYDANNQVGASTTDRVRWPRLEAEATYESKLGDAGMFKLFANAAHQKVYAKDGDTDNTIKGLGFGGRAEFGPVGVGLAGHTGQGIGVNFALEPSTALTLGNKYRDVDGGAVHVRVAPSDKFDFMTAWGITRVHQLPGDTVDTYHDGDNNPATPPENDDAVPGLPDAVRHVTIKDQAGVSFGGTYHVSPHLHITAEYFKAMYTWHKPTPAPVGAKEAEQNFDVVNLGVTYDF
ncbi:MAG: hypothetical protein RJA70_4458 [Pseudomonadota bacterium]|jgi:hypothetical protein